MNLKIAVLSGDGIGPEVILQAKKALYAIGVVYDHEFVFEEALMGAIAIDKTGNPLPEQTLNLCLNTDAVLLGAIGDPKYGANSDSKVTPEQGLLRLRKELGLFANIRPLKPFKGLLDVSPLKREIVEGVDFVIFRELTAGIYFVALLITMVYAFRVKKPDFQLSIPHNVKGILEYTFYIILSGSVANLLLDGDKIMLNQYMDIGNIAFYSVATYIALVISVPSRAMHQIVYPITAKLMHENKHDELNDLYKKTSVNLQIVGGFVMLCIFVNIDQLYEMLPKDYAGGIWIVFIIGISKYFDLILGNNNAIIFNSKYYRMVLFLGLMLVFFTIVLNAIFIPLYGITGSAIATLLSITIYSVAKLMFVVKRMHLYPFTIQTVYSIVITAVLFVLFYFWKFPFHPIIGIVLKSILVTVLYVYINYKFSISKEINEVLNSLYKKYKF